MSPARQGFLRWMEVWWTQYEAWKLQAEYATNGYSTELQEYKSLHPIYTLKEYMIDTRGQPRM